MENTLGLQIEITKELNEMLMRTCDIRFYEEQGLLQIERAETATAAIFGKRRSVLA